MSADVAQVSLRELENFDYDKYQDGGSGSSYAPPPEGKYYGQAPLITDEAFGSTREGYLKLNIDPITIINSPAPNATGYKVRFTSASAKKFKNREGSQVLDFLRACGIAARPKTNDELKAACKMASGRTFQFTLVWEAYNKDTQETISGAENFPLDPANPDKRQSFVEDVNNQDDQGRNKRIYANGKVRYFVSAINGKA